MDGYLVNVFNPEKNDYSEIPIMLVKDPTDKDYIDGKVESIKSELDGIGDVIKTLDTNVDYTIYENKRWNSSGNLTDQRDVTAVEIAVNGGYRIKFTDGVISANSRNFVVSVDDSISQIDDLSLLTAARYLSEEPYTLMLGDTVNRVRLTLTKSTLFDCEYVDKYIFQPMADANSLKKVDDKVNDVSKEVVKIKDTIADLNVPEYWKETIENKAKTIQSIMTTAFLNKEEINAFFVRSDSHYPANNNVSPKLMKYLSKKCGINLLVDCGDILGDRPTHSDNIKEIESAMENSLLAVDRLIVCQGNHDNGVGTPDNGFLKKERIVYDNEWVLHVMNRLITTPKIVFEPNVRKAFYYDDDVLKIRFISIDIFENDTYTDDGNGNVTVTLGKPSNTQIEWINNVALENIPSGYAVVTFAHLSLFKPQVNGTQIPFGYTTLLSAVTAKLKSLTNDYIGHFCGHLHHDFLTTDDGITSVQLLNDGIQWREKTYFSGYEDLVGDSPLKIKGTTNECSFDAVVVNRTTKHVDLVKIGAGENNQFDY